MKLRNKKTGEIVIVEFLSNWQTDDGTEIGFRERNTNIVYSYTSLAELNEEWEDVVEESKKYWFINPCGEVVSFYEEDENLADTKASKAIGDYFDTREEAEKAVEKLKAWKRLKDKGLEIKRLVSGDEYGNTLTYGITLTFTDYIECDDALGDLDLLFGGEE